MTAPAHARKRWRPLGWIARGWIVLACAAAIGLALANAHLVQVAFSSQPECIPHLKQPGSADGAYRAAKSAC